MRKIYPYVICFLCVLICLGTCIGCDKKTNVSDETGTLTQVVYQGNNTIFPNPERGFYRHTSCDLGTGVNLLDEATLNSYRQGNYSLILRVFYLKSFKDKALSTQALEDFDKDMAMIRKAGLKCILRFAYSEAMDEPDAPLTIIQQHLDQLKPHLEKNVDVIAIMQAGLIGAWGEWYYTTNNLNNDGARAMVLNKLLEVLPTNRMLQVRTRAYKTAYLQRTDALQRSEAFNQTKVSRLGHHNDCFMASVDDYGTYQDVEADKNYLNKEGLYVPMGGETCPPEGVDPADCQKAQSEMRRLRWTFLNEDYYLGVNDRWKVQGCMDNIIRELGYRFELVAGEYSKETAPGNTLQVNLRMLNQGYACLYNERPVELILKNKKSGEIYLLKTDIDPRFWQPSSESQIKIVAGVPESISEGEYTLYLNLPDAESSLYNNPAYSIRLANDNMWEGATGYNNLNMDVKIHKAATSEKYTGELIFRKK